MEKKISYKNRIITLWKENNYKNVIRILNDILDQETVSKKGQTWKEALPAQG